MGLDQIIEISHKISDPYIKSAEAWKFATKLIAFLLVLSVISNIYLCTRDVQVIFEAKENIESSISQIKE